MIHLPVKGFTITSPYGQRNLNGVWQFHDGVDCIGNIDAVCAIADGLCIYDFDHYVEAARWDLTSESAAGNYIILQHLIDGQIYFSKYVHLAKNVVSVGNHVKCGDMIGNYADVGYSFGAHLHLSVYNSAWQTIDPMILLTKASA
jgi:murein DD-endopeptidase MepM/ murein hydrolase activator NlpD